MSDQLQRFIFEDYDIRGEITRLEASYQQVLETHQYPEPVALLLGQFLAAATLLSATLKFDGILTLQARSEGEVPLIMAEATSEQTVRGICKDAEQASSDDFQRLLHNGQLCITIDPKQGQRYQGIVALDGNNLAQCLEQYFKQSEQLSTRIWLSADGTKAAGILLQELPSNSQSNAEHQQQWQHVTQLAETLTEQELLQLPFDQLLYRLYHQEQVRLFEPAAMRFQCHCSSTRTLKALATLNPADLKEIIQRQSSITISCEFCHQQYQFDEADLQPLLNPTLH